jgi:hypothetical protein
MGGTVAKPIRLYCNVVSKRVLEADGGMVFVKPACRHRTSHGLLMVFSPNRLIVEVVRKTVSWGHFATRGVQGKESFLYGSSGFFVQDFSDRRGKLTHDDGLHEKSADAKVPRLFLIDAFAETGAQEHGKVRLKP